MHVTLCLVKCDFFDKVTVTLHKLSMHANILVRVSVVMTNCVSRI